MMPIYEDFYSSILPGNYALTKSMELTKIQSCGTLWYTKKFLVLYYYIFLSNEILTQEYIEKVTNSFDLFIDSLDDSVKESAYNFFYPEDGVINFKSEEFKTFASFSAHTDFETQAEMNEHYNSAKKMYFTLLMGSGGQTGIKKLLKDACQKIDFTYSKDNINKILFDAVVSICTEQVNQFNRITDNSIKYIISKAAIDEICNNSYIKKLSEEDVRNIICSFDDNDYRYRSILVDVVAFIRNERQMLFYYGYFHSKSAGASDFEFSSLTPIGELAIDANYYEFLAIWEHQKIKMISQPATADINNVPRNEIDKEHFSISYRPYTDVLGHIMRNNELSLNQYKYIVSRKNHYITEEQWILGEKDILNNVDIFRERVESFGRRGDITDEDGRKEILKYALGVRSDLPFDNSTNPLGSIYYSQSKWMNSNKEKLTFIYNIYSKLEDYKIQRYEDLFQKCESDLKQRYIRATEGDYMPIDRRIKIDWDLYNIRMDKFIMLSVISVISSAKVGILSFDGTTREITNIILDVVNNNFSGLLKKIGIKTNTSKRNEIQTVISALVTNDWSKYTTVLYDEEAQVVAHYREVSAEDLRTRIIEISTTAATAVVEGRIRNTKLVSLLKSYYMARYLVNDLLKCECCNKETFITNSGEPYVEFHHLIPFNIAEGPDHYLNMFALCPNCHRKIHFLNLTEKRAEYDNINNNNYLKMTFVERLRQLKTEMILRSYHLEYLLAENAITQDEYNTIAA